MDHPLPGICIISDPALTFVVALEEKLANLGYTVKIISPENFLKNRPPIPAARWVYFCICPLASDTTTIQAFNLDGPLSDMVPAHVPFAQSILFYMHVLVLPLNEYASKTLQRPEYIARQIERQRFFNDLNAQRKLHFFSIKESPNFEKLATILGDDRLKEKALGLGTLMALFPGGGRDAKPGSSHPQGSLQATFSSSSSPSSPIITTPNGLPPLFSNAAVDLCLPFPSPAPIHLVPSDQKLDNDRLASAPAQLQMRADQPRVLVIVRDETDIFAAAPKRTLHICNTEARLPHRCVINLWGLSCRHCPSPKRILKGYLTREKVEFDQGGIPFEIKGITITKENGLFALKVDVTPASCERCFNSLCMFEAILEYGSPSRHEDGNARDHLYSRLLLKSNSTGNNWPKRTRDSRLTLLYHFLDHQKNYVRGVPDYIWELYAGGFQHPEPFRQAFWALIRACLHGQVNPLPLDQKIDDSEGELYDASTNSSSHGGKGEETASADMDTQQ